MLTILLVIIYISFISLGLPDSLLGSAWPIIHKSLAVPVSAAGIISIIISGGTIISSFFSSKLIKRFGTGKVTVVSVAMTAIALLSFSLSPHFIWLCIAAIPLGLGAGAVDSGLNNFVALHYEAKHMSWLHCFWGIGATTGPVIMSYFLANGGEWKKGYLTIAIIQAFLVILLFLTLSFWKKVEGNVEEDEKTKGSSSLAKLLKLKGAKAALISFFCYCTVESTAGLWGSTYLVRYHGIAADTAAKWISLFYFGITFGRFLSGFLTLKLNNKTLIRIGQLVCITGAILLFILPKEVQYIGFILIGLGCAPIYPSMLHETPNRFGKDLSSEVMGIQMAFAYVGSTFMPPLFGVIAGKVGMYLIPVFIIIGTILMVLSSERINFVVSVMNRKVKKVQ